MISKLTKYLSVLLDYPGENFKEEIFKVKKELSAAISETVNDDLNKFIKFIEEENLGRLQEMYTATYDIHGICSLDVGFILFGEDYKRGEFLVNISRLQRQYKVNLKSELADHLPNFLKLLSAMTDDEEQREELIQKILIPAIDIMSSKFTHNSNNGFGLTLKIIKDTIFQFKKHNTQTTGVFPC